MKRPLIPLVNKAPIDNVYALYQLDTGALLCAERAGNDYIICFTFKSAAEQFRASTGTIFALATGPLGQRNHAYGALQGRHSGGANYLLSDGHVKRLRGDAVSDGITRPASERPDSCEDSDFPLEAAGTECSSGWAATYSPI